MIYKNLIIEDANIGRGGFRNFSGKRGAYNKNGARTFTILFDEATGRSVEDLGWKVKWRGPREEGDDPIGLFTVTIRFNDPNYPVEIKLKTGDNETILDEDSVSILDVSDIERADVIIRPYNWSMDGDSGTKPMLEKLEVTLKETGFDTINGRYNR